MDRSAIFFNFFLFNLIFSYQSKKYYIYLDLTLFKKEKKLPKEKNYLY
jgi:hypothetical protein